MSPQKNPQTIDPYAATAEKEVDDPYAATAEGVSPISGEGTYKMQNAQGTIFDVPFSKVEPTAQLGYSVASPDKLRWLKDRAFDLKTKSKYKLVRPALNALPTIGGIVGGIIGGGAGSAGGPTAIATGALGAAAGGGLGEDLRQFGEKAVFGKDADVPTTAKGTVKALASQAALQGGYELGGRAVGVALNPAVRSLGNAAKVTEETGVRVAPSEAAGKAASYVERLAKGSIISGGKMAEFRELQNAETQKLVENLVDSIDKFSGTREELGNMVQSGIKQHKEGFRAIQKKLYGEIDNLVGKRVVKVPVYKQVPTGVLDASGKPIMRSVISGTQDTVVDNVMPSTKGYIDANGKYVDGLKDFARKELAKLDQEEKVFSPALLKKGRKMLQTILKAPDNMNFEAIANARSDALGIARKLDKGLSGKEAGFAKKMAELFDDSMMDAAKKSGIADLPEKVRAANEVTAKEHEMFAQALVKKIVKTKKPQAIASMLIGGEDVLGNQEVRDLFTILPKDLHAPVQRQVIVDALQDSIDPASKVFNERKFAETISEMGDERGKIIFGSNWNNIQKISSLLHKINGPATLGGGGTGASFQNIATIKKLLIFASGAAGATGHYGAAVASAGLSFLGDWVGFNTLAFALTHPATATQLLKSLQVLARGAAYVPGLAYNETGGKQPRKELEELKRKGSELMTPKPAPVAPQPAPQITHIYNESTDSLEPYAVE